MLKSEQNPVVAIVVCVGDKKRRLDVGSGAVLALVCGFGQMPMLDAYGNFSCVQAETQQERKVESTVGECPTGMFKLLTQAGVACVDKDAGKAYYQLKGMCPNGSYRGLDRWGNEACLR